VDGRAWIDSLPSRLEPQRNLLRALVDAVDRDPRFRALALGCSIARGNADELSDIDVGLWTTDEAWPEAAETTRDLLESLGDVLDALVQPDPPGPWIVVHYTSGIDIDASVRRASDAKGRVPELIVLLDRDGLLARPYEPPSLRADPERIREWRFLAWWELGNVAKYLDRGALWEALRWLEDVRRTIARLHASQLGVPYPEYGVTSIFDVAGADVPAGFGKTYARTDLDDVRRAARACMQLLEPYDPPPLAAWVRERLL
jgi:predicted nucleotidyltransferase